MAIDPVTASALAKGGGAGGLPSFASFAKSAPLAKVAGGVFKGIGSAIEAQRLREEERSKLLREEQAEERALGRAGATTARQQNLSSIQILQQQREGAFEKFRFSKARDAILGAF